MSAFHRTRPSTVRVAALCALALAGALGPACSRQDQPPAPPTRRLTLIERGATDSWNRGLRTGAAKVARESERTQMVMRSAVEPGFNQAEAVRAVLTDRPAALVLIPDASGGAALATALGEVVASGVPVILVDDYADGPTAGVPAPRVTSDDGAAGELAADYLIEKLPQGGEVMVVGDGSGSQGPDRRDAAFRARLARGQGMVSVSAPAQTPERRAAQLAVEYAFEEHPGVSAIFCPDGTSTAGALQVLRERGLAGRVRLVGVDPTPEVVGAMAAGEVDAIVVRSPVEIGRRAVLTALARANGEAVDQSVMTPVVLVTRESMHEKANMDLLLPDLAGANN